MKSKVKFLSAFLCMLLLIQCNTIIFADETEVNIEEFNPDEEFSEYISYNDIHYGRFFAVSNSEKENSNAVFDKGIQATDFIFDSITADIFGYSFIVTQNIDGVKTYGMIDFKYFDNKEYENNKEIEYSLPIKYKNIEYKIVNSSPVFIAENFDGTNEYYLNKENYLSDKQSFNNSTYDIEYEDCGKIIKIKSLDDVPNPVDSSSVEKTPIEGLDGCYIMEDGSGFYVNIVDENGNKLVDTDFRQVDNKLSLGETLVVWYPVGMTDSSAGVLSKDLKVIVPKGGGYTAPKFLESGNDIYIEMESVFTGNKDYYDLNGNIVEKPTNVNIAEESSDNKNILKNDTSFSKWAEESIKNAVALGIVPENIQSKYTDKITRAEFCKLAVQTYITKTEKSIDMNVKTPFTDADDAYITTAYNLKIAAGIGNNKFAPDNNITRQEAAVMLNNLASLLEINNNISNSEKFVDENSFAKWAKDAIYNVSGIKSGDTFVMVGTGEGKFSPLTNYTREQAISTMIRLYNCEKN